MRASVKGLLGTLIGKSFFWRRGISFRFGPFVFLLTEAIFSFNFWKAASIVSLGEAKNCFIFGTKLWLQVWSQNLSFVEFVVDNSRLACVGSGRMRAEWVIAALLWFYKHDSGKLSSETNPLPQAAPWRCIHELTHAAFQASRRCNGTAEVLPSVSKVPGVWEKACPGVLKVSCRGVGIMGFTKFGDKRINDLDLLQGYVVGVACLHRGNSM